MSTDPAGLDAAIKAVVAALPASVLAVEEYEAILTAAAPHIRAGALRDAADALPQPRSGDDDMAILAVEATRALLRERADQIERGER